jgi:hypothetical protein
MSSLEENSEDLQVKHSLHPNPLACALPDVRNVPKLTFIVIEYGFEIHEMYKNVQKDCKNEVK